MRCQLALNAVIMKFWLCFIPPSLAVYRHVYFLLQVGQCELLKSILIVVLSDPKLLSEPFHVIEKRPEKKKVVNIPNCVLNLHCNY